MGAQQSVSSYVEHLPALLRQGPLVGGLLLAFEAVLSGLEQVPPRQLAALLQIAVGETPAGLEQLLERVHEFFDPTKTPEEFLPWLSQWAAAALRNDWSVETKRAFLSNIVPLYQRRGTLPGLQGVLELVVGDVKVSEIPQSPLAHHFLVEVRVLDPDPSRLAHTVEEVREIVDREKPAHTTYALRIEYPAMRISERIVRDEHGHVVEGIVIGENTVLGTSTELGATFSHSARGVDP